VILTGPVQTSSPPARVVFQAVTLAVRLNAESALMVLKLTPSNVAAVTGLKGRTNSATMIAANNMTAVFPST